MNYISPIGPWLVELINPPPRDLLTVPQKVGRVLLVTLTVLTLCVISALLVAVGFFLVQRSGDALAGVPQLMNALTILSVSVVVNVACVWALFQIKKLDHQLIPRDEGAADAPIAPRR